MRQRERRFFELERRRLSERLTEEDLERKILDARRGDRRAVVAWCARRLRDRAENAALVCVCVCTRACARAHVFSPLCVTRVRGCMRMFMRRHTQIHTTAAQCMCVCLMSMLVSQCIEITQTDRDAGD